MNNNASFRLILQNDGTYLELVPASLGGTSIDFNELCEYLIQRHIEFDKLVISDALKNLQEKKILKLNNVSRSPENESVKVWISQDRMEAYGRFYPPSLGGSELTYNEIINDLVKAGVKYGVVEENINKFLETKSYYSDILLAKATPCQMGTNAKITYYFNTDLTKKPKMNEDGTVDFHQLDTISRVRRNELLASLEPAVPGRPGINVCGSVIMPPKVNHLILRHGNKIHLSEDKLKMYSDVDGHASLVDDKVFVSDSYEVPADVDASTGDISYDGNVVVKGSVRTGYQIIASGDIEVEGVVEGAVLVAGGQIVLKRGVQGMNKGVLRAQSNVVAKFIENATVEAGGYVSTEAILHSKVSAKGDIIAGGRKGFITGGEIRSGTMISVKTAGSTMGTNTLLEVGVDPQIIEEYHKLEKELPTLGQEIERLNQNLTLYLKKIKSGEKLSADKLLLVKTMSVNKEQLEKKKEEIEEQINKLQQNMDEHVTGSINVSDTIYPGCKLIIAGVVYFIRKETVHCTLVRYQGDVIVTPYKL